MVTFDGSQKLMVCNEGTTTIDVRLLYSLWKIWAKTENNLKYAKAFEVVGGEPTSGDNIITPYFFVMNGWKIRPQEANHTLKVEGIILTNDQSSVFVDTLECWRVSIQSILPIYTETVMVSSGSGLSTEEHNKLMAIPQATEISNNLLNTTASDHNDTGTVGKVLNDTLKQARLSVSTNFV